MIDIMKCPDGVVILQDGVATAFKGDWMVSDWDQSVDKVSHFKRCKNQMEDGIDGNRL